MDLVVKSHDNNSSVKPEKLTLDSVNVDTVFKPAALIRNSLKDTENSINDTDVKLGDLTEGNKSFDNKDGPKADQKELISLT